MTINMRKIKNIYLHIRNIAISICITCTYTMYINRIVMYIMLDNVFSGIGGDHCQRID